MKENLLKHKKLVIGIVVVLIWVAIFVVVAIMMAPKPNPAPIQVTNPSRIQNGNASDARLGAMNWMITQMAQQNSCSVESTDAVIRDGTFSSSYDATTKIELDSFIVDIAKCKQSYGVTYAWSNDPDVSDTLQNSESVGVSCLMPKYLTLGSFNCISFNGSKDSAPAVSGSSNLSVLPIASISQSVPTDLQNYFQSHPELNISSISIESGIILTDPDNPNGWSYTVPVTLNPGPWQVQQTLYINIKINSDMTTPYALLLSDPNGQNMTTIR